MTQDLFGRYQIVGELGQGAMGTVYKAVDPLIERSVAIKTINLNLSKDEIEEFERRFLREAKSAGRLNHPNIVTIYDVGRTDHAAYMAMELLDGQTLRDLLDTGAVLPVERIAEIAAQVAEGLAAAHAAEVIHRDIKPANIMILASGVAKITDFGVALIPSASRTMAGVVLGSPKYMSPEQVVGQTVDGRSDIFSLGVVLYEMLTGRAPFQGENISAVMYQVLNEQPPLPSSIQRSLPAALDAITLRALAKHPDDRYQSAAELARDLRGYASLDPARVPHPGARSLERRKTPRIETGDATVVSPSLSGTVELFDRTTSPAAAPAAPAAPARRLPIALTGGALALLAGGVWLFSADAPPPAPTEPPAAQTVAAPAAPETAAAPAADPAPTGKPRPTATTAAAPVETNRTADKPAEKTSPAEKPEVAPALLEFAVTPWGEIYIDGKKRGTVPPDSRLRLPPGSYQVEIRNTAFPPYRETVTLKADENRRIRHQFKGDPS